MIRTTLVLALSSLPLAAQTNLATYPDHSRVVGGHDLNQDGVVDLVLGAPLDDTAGTDAGAVYVRSGATGGLLWWHFGGAAGDNLGAALALTPDLDGDGVWEVIVGAPGVGILNNGMVRVLSGRTSAPLWDFFGNEPNAGFGSAVAGDFDMNQDGVPDIACGAPNGGFGSGHVHLFEGTGYPLGVWDGGPLAISFFGRDLLGGVDVDANGFNDLVASGMEAIYIFSTQKRWEPSNGTPMGLTLADGGNTDGDGEDEILIGDPSYDIPFTDCGAVWRFEYYPNTTATSSSTFVFGNAPGEQFGSVVAGIGDINGDGADDLAVGATHGGSSPGYVRVISGKFTNDSFELSGTPATDFPESLAGVGDLNSDGFLDLAIADPTAGSANDGLVAVYSAAGPGFVNYCTPGTSASGCSPSLSASGTPAAFQVIPFVLTATGVEGNTPGLFFYGWNGRQANAWGNGTSLQCVAPPVKRGGLLPKAGTAGQCDGAFSQDLNAHWNGNFGKTPPAGTVCQAQLWYRDPFNTSNQTTSMTDALEFFVDF